MYTKLYGTLRPHSQNLNTRIIVCNPGTLLQTRFVEHCIAVLLVHVPRALRADACMSSDGVHMGHILCAVSSEVLFHQSRIRAYMTVTEHLALNASAAHK